MGSKNRQRRAEQLRQRAQAEARRRATAASASRPPGPDGDRRSGPGQPPGPGGSAPNAPFVSAELIAEVLRNGAANADDPRIVAQLLEALDTIEQRRVQRESEGELLRSVGRVWRNGWQPAELARQARRADARVARLVTDLIAADHLPRAADTLHPRWAQQIAALGLPTIPRTRGWLGSFSALEGLDDHARTRLVFEALRLLMSLGPITVLIPPPGSDLRETAAPSATADDDPILFKVRALLAQTESTTYEAEAEAFTAKAQELMARHAIDAAVVWSTAERGERPVSIRLPIDDPYADAKSMLLHVVAEASKCRCIGHGACGMSTLVGFAPDIAATELMFTSLLVQSASALQLEGATAPPGARTRSRAFRSSFLLAYAVRVGERLATVNADVQSQAEHEVGASLLPVLAARDVAVTEAVDEMFGELRRSSVRGARDALGWSRGEQAADRAQLDGTPLTEGTNRPRAALTA